MKDTHAPSSFSHFLTMYQGEEDLKQWGPKSKEIPPSEGNDNKITEWRDESSCLPTELAQMCPGNEFLKRYI